MDIFVIDSVFLGKLSSIRIGHSETKLGTFRKNLSLLLFTMCVSLFHHFIIVINEAPRKLFFFFFFFFKKLYIRKKKRIKTIKK